MTHHAVLCPLRDDSPPPDVLRLGDSALWPGEELLDPIDGGREDPNTGKHHEHEPSCREAQV